MSNQIYRIEDLRFGKLKTHSIINRSSSWGLTLNSSYGPTMDYGDTWRGEKNFASFIESNGTAEERAIHFNGVLASIELNNGKYLNLCANVWFETTEGRTGYSNGYLRILYTSNPEVYETSNASVISYTEATYIDETSTAHFIMPMALFQLDSTTEDTILGLCEAEYYTNYKEQNSEGQAFTHVSFGSIFCDWAVLAKDYDIPLGSDGTPFTGSIIFYDDRAYGETSEDAGYGQDGDEGYGSFDDSSDEVELPDVTNIPVNISTSGLFGIYTPTQGELESIGRVLWSTGFFDNILKNAQSPMDNIISLHVVPVTPEVTGTTPNVYIGNYNTQVTSNVVATDYVTFDCGTLDLPEYWANYLDYEGTSIKLWLPFYGFVNVDPSQINGGSINVTYNFNVFSGDFVVYVKCDAKHSELNSITQIYAGNAKIQLPMTGADYSRCYSGVIEAASGVIQAGASIASGNAAGAVNGLGQAVNGGMKSMSPDFQRSGNFTGGGALMTILTPYLMIDRVGYSISDTYRAESGLPLNVTYTLSELSGFTQLKDFHLDGIACTMEEKALIESALRKGVIL